MGGQFGQDLAAVGLGISEAINERTLTQIANRRAQEEKALRDVSRTLAESGQLHLLPEEVTKGIAKRGGKDLFASLMEMSQIKASELAPRRAAQADFLSLINAPVNRLAVPGGQATINEPPQQPRSGAPQIRPQALPQPTRPVSTGPTITPQVQGQAPLGTPSQAAPPIESQVEVEPQGPLGTVEAGTQQRQITPEINPNPAGLTVRTEGQRGSSRPPTAFERTMRINNLSPVGIALAFGDNDLGTLQVQGGQLQQQRARLEFDRSKLALAQVQPKYATTLDTLDTDGNRIKAALFYMPDGTTQLTPLAPGLSGNAAQQALTTMKRIDDQLLNPRISAEKRKRLEKDRLNQERVFGKALEKGGIKIDIPSPQVPIISKDGRYLGTAAEGDEVSIRRIKNRDQARALGTEKETGVQRSTLYNGNTALKMIDDVLATATPLNTGLIGAFTRKLQSLATLVGAAPQAFGSFSTMVGRARSEIQNAETRALGNRLIKEFDSSSDFVDATTKALAVVLAKSRDPDSVVRETEYENALGQLEGAGGLFGSSYNGLIARFEVARRDIVTRMINAHIGLQNKEATIRQLLGDDTAVAPLIDPNLDLPEEITNPQRSNVPGLPDRIRASNAPITTADAATKRLNDFQTGVEPILQAFGLQALPDPVMQQITDMVKRNPNLTAQTLVDAANLLIGRHIRLQQQQQQPAPTGGP